MSWFQYFSIVPLRPSAFFQILCQTLCTRVGMEPTVQVSVGFDQFLPYHADCFVPSNASNMDPTSRSDEKI